MTSPAMKHRLSQLQDECDRLRPLADAARATLTHDDSRAKRDAAWGELRTLLASYRAGDSGEAAIYLVGRAQQLVAHADEPGVIIAAYEAAKARLRGFEEDARRRELTRQESES